MEIDYVNNYIESQYIEVSSFKNMTYVNLYKGFANSKLQLIFSTLHFEYIRLFKAMNTRLPNGPEPSHFLAEDSRDLINIISITRGLCNNLNNSEYAFKLEDYYSKIISECSKYLRRSGGSEVPANTSKINLYYTIPIFIGKNTIIVDNCYKNYSLKPIGEGSYAKVYRYRDEHYKCPFILKRANKDLNDKELKRFKHEFEVMKKLNSPYIAKVYSFDEYRNEYVMESMDCNLKQYIDKNNSSLTIKQRKNIINQILKAFEYLDKKRLLHRDISPENILINDYDDGTVVVKISDFGLVKDTEQHLTSLNSSIKGYLNDPDLKISGFASYSKVHETYALTEIICYIWTGRQRVSDVKSKSIKEFINRGLNSDKSKRYSDVFSLKQALEQAFKQIM